MAFLSAPGVVSTALLLTLLNQVLIISVYIILGTHLGIALEATVYFAIIPLVFLADVPGFMIGTQVERQGIIRHGAKMITAITQATVPKICVVVRKAYGAGLYAMCGPAFDPIATLALPTAKIAVMGPEAAINAVYANRIAEISDQVERSKFIADKRREYEEDVELSRLASELVIDAVVPFEELRRELINRFAHADPVDRDVVAKRHGVHPG